MFKKILGLFLILSISSNLSAKDLEATLVSDPEGATVYLNGMIVAQTTPAIINLDKKHIEKNLVLRFDKAGYESKTVITSLSKKDLKKGAIIYAKMDKLPDAAAVKAEKVYKNDPTIPQGQANARVSRDNPGDTEMERTIIRWYFDSDPRGARIYYRVISNNPAEVKNTNETYLTTTPYEETKSFGIQGLTYENSRNVTVEIKVSKKGYADQIKRYNVRQALDQQEISGFFELVPTDAD
ncbi:MAG: hypothetical protein J1F05_05990 [Muribaculaceae bacterium]|nr:hypothetical protein [Muribaculaceae bacterium]